MPSIQWLKTSGETTYSAAFRRTLWSLRRFQVFVKPHQQAVEIIHLIGSSPRGRRVAFALVARQKTAGFESLK